MPTPSETEFRFRDIALAAYGPTIVNSIGHGAVIPVLALQARHLGAGVSMAAFVVAALGMGSLLSSLPTGALVARIGERRALIGAGLIDAVLMVAAWRATNPWVLALLMALSGMTWTAYLIARQGFMIDAVPERLRARAMSGLGGSFRVGVFIGPLLGAGLISHWGIKSVFLLAAAMSLLAAALAGTMPDLGSQSRADAAASGHLSVGSVLRAHRFHLLTLGLAVVIIASSRAVRISLLPLWADHLGLSASTTSLIFAVAAALDIAMFYPGGWLMDRYGRMVVGIPVVASAAAACLLLPLAGTAATLTAVMVLIALGNGLSSGIVLTLGADTAPADGRAQYLGAWRLAGDIGGSGAPLLISGLAALMPLAAVCLAIGSLLSLGTGWVGYWTHRLDQSRRAAQSSAAR